MVLNDVFDFETDQQERPDRPLPSGRIPLGRAKVLGFGMLAAGVLAAVLSGLVPGNDVAISWRGAAVGFLLATSILLYDRVLKKTLIGPVAMGLCRFFNVLLGMSAATTLVGTQTMFLGYSPDELLVAASIGIFVIGVTWFARTEAKVSNNAILTLAAGVMLVGIFLLGVFPYYSERFQIPKGGQIVWPILIFAFTFSIGKRCYAAIIRPTPQNVQIAVKQFIFSLILLDAAVVVVVMQRQWQYPLLVLALSIPMLVLGRWIKST